MPPKKELEDFDDAALARALQEEYEREYRRRGMQQHLRGGGSGRNNTSPYQSSSPSWSPSPPPPRAAAAAASALPYNYHEPPPPRPSAPPASQIFEQQSSFLCNNTPTGFFDEIEIGDEYDDASFGPGPIRSSAAAPRMSPPVPPPLNTSTTQRRGSSSGVPVIVRGTAVVPTTNLEPTMAAIPPKKKRSNSSSNHRDNVTASPTAYGNSAYPVHRGNGNGVAAAASPNSNSRPPISEFTLVRAKTRYTTATPEQAPPLAGMSASALTGLEMSEDELLARRLEQELRDEDYARQMMAQEQVRRHHATSHELVTSRINNNHGIATTAAARPCCGICLAFRKCVCFIVSLVLLAIAAVLVLYLFDIDSKVGDFIPTPEDFRGEDPFNNSNPDDANLWRTNGAGLVLTIINALDENWHANFDTAVSEWDNGTPDALTLTTELGQPDSVCRAINGRVKVCNGDYGATNWRGINKVLLENNRIYSSAARMNDFYVKDSDTAQKQYTMCHEIGHAFGLPHTDEDFYNKDLKNCMDYTSRPENNKQPAAPNFEFLTTLYGSIDGTIPQGGTMTGTPSVQSAQDVEPDGESDDDTDKKDKNKDDRRRGRRSLTSKVLPPEIELALDEIDAWADSGMIGADSTSQQKGWRLLHASEHGQAHEIDLGDGYVVQLHMLGVAPQ